MFNRHQVLAVTFFVLAAFSLHAQNVSTARRRADFQAGGGIVYGHADYDGNVRGGGIYASLDVTSHLGGEIDFHQADAPNSAVYERTYEIGPRYYRTYGRFKPYAKILYGRGVFNFPQNVANLAYNEFAIGGGVDVQVKRWLNFRADYEAQRWLGFPPNGLTPQLLTIGVAYHFPGGLRRGEHY